MITQWYRQQFADQTGLTAWGFQEGEGCMSYMSSEDAVHVCLLPLPFAVSFSKERGRRGKKGGKRDFPLQKENRIGSREAAISPSNPA